MKYLGTNLTKYVPNLYAKNYKIFLKEIKDQTTGETYHVHGLEDST